MVRLELSFYGHPVSANRWEGKADKEVTACNFHEAQDSTYAGLEIYVDVFELVTTAEDTPKVWKQLAKHIVCKEEQHAWKEDTTGHIGCVMQFNKERIMTAIKCYRFEHQ